MFGGVELDFDDDLAQEQTSRKEKRKEKVDKPRDKDRRESESKERRKHRDPNESREDKERRRSERRKRREEEGQETSRSHKSKARDQTTPPDAELEIAVVAPNIYDAEMDLLKKAGMGKNRNPTAEPIPIAPVALKEVSSRVCSELFVDQMYHQFDRNLSLLMDPQTEAPNHRDKKVMSRKDRLGHLKLPPNRVELTQNQNRPRGFRNCGIFQANRAPARYLKHRECIPPNPSSE
eukprot:c17587_g1_i5.p1 GENE.c17587_g1_i5~~c17587_g1_i5.p1  ORF type:complete len:255 (-),score=38.12 c17587_g1_i5:377-1081(-)